MLKRLVLLAVVLFGTVLGGVAFIPSTVLASTPQDEICQGVGTVTGAGCDSGISLGGVVRNVINVFSVIIGILAVIMIMVAGFKYITAGGEASNITSAKNTLVYAIVGLIIAALSQFIVQFVLDSVG